MKLNLLRTLAVLAVVTFYAVVVRLRHGGTANPALPGTRLPTTPPPDPKESELDQLPVGMEVTCSPKPVEAVPGGRSGTPFTWEHETRVRTTVGRLHIVEFGGFAWMGNCWRFSNQTRKPFTPDDFVDWYSCPQATLEPGQSYADPQDWSGAYRLGPNRTRLYYIAVDDIGRRFKGECVLTQLGRLCRPQ